MRRGTLRIRSLTLTAGTFLLVGALLPTPAAAQERECGLDVQPTGGVDVQYQPRGTRCEGLFVQLQNAPMHLRVLSLIQGGVPGLTHAFDSSFDGQGIDTLVVEPTEARARVVGAALDPGINWALDGPRQGASYILWDLREVFRSLPEPLPKVGIVARSGDDSDPVYSPVKVYQPGSPPQSDRLILVFQIPGAGGARVCPPPGECQPPLEPMSTGSFNDGVFATTIDLPSDSVAEIGVVWRRAGDFQPIRDSFLVRGRP